MAAETDAFRQLNDAELAALEQLGVRRAVSAGEYLYREGDPGYDFYVVLAGAVEIVVNSEGKDRVIARHSPGRFLARRAILMTGASSAIRVIGSRFSPDSSRVREFLVRNRIPHEWLDPDARPPRRSVRQGAGTADCRASRTPRTRRRAGNPVGP